MDRNTLSVFGLIILGVTVYLSFANWRAAVIVLLFIICANTARAGRK